MKKLGVILVLAVLLILASVTVSAAETSGTCGENLTWKIEGTVLTISGTGPMTEFDAQNSAPWGDSHMVITEVIIEDGVTTIGGNSFPHFENMTKLTIPDTLQKIGAQAFLHCKSLEGVEIPESVTKIATFAFAYCSAMEKVVIPSSEQIHMDAFYGCRALKEIWFYGDAPLILDNAFGDVTATAYYPAGNATWTADKLDNYGGTLTWKATCYDGHTEVPDAAVAAGCTTPGLTAGKHCSACGTVTQEQQEIKATGHSFGEWKQTKAPTTQAVGKAERKCSTCGTIEQKDIPKLTAQEPAPTDPKPTEPAPTDPQPTTGQTQPTEPAPTQGATDPEPTTGQTEPQGTEPEGTAGETELQGTVSTDPTTEPTEPVVQVAEPESKTPWVAIAIAGVLILAGGAAAAWFFVIRKRR